MQTRKAVVLISVAGLLGLLAGALLGPQMHAFFWSEVLDRCPDTAAKNRACLRLRASELGRDSLYDHLDSPSSAVRSLSAWTLASAEDPDAAVSLFSRVPEADVDGRIDILRGMVDLPRQYSWVVSVLQTELGNSRNSPRVRAEIRRLLESCRRAASARMPATTKATAVSQPR